MTINQRNSPPTASPGGRFVADHSDVIAPRAAERSAAESPRVVSAEGPPLRKLADFPYEFRERARRIRCEHSHLYGQPVLEHADGRRTFHQGVLHRRHGLNVLFLKGDAVEMAFQHARLLSHEISAGAVEPSARIIEHAVANSYGKMGLLQRLFCEGIDRFITRAMLNCSTRAAHHTGDEESLDEAAALSDATGIDVMTLVRSLFNPEVLMTLATLDNDARRIPVRLQPGLVAPITCSTFAAWGNRTADGGMLIGRNMDYPLNGYFDRYPTVIYGDPADGGPQFMTVVSAGVHTCGLHGYNDAGLFVSSHTVPTSDTATRGVPVFTTANRVIRHATSFDAAVELFRKSRPPSGWAYFLASIQEGRVGTVELSNSQVEVREARGTFHVQTNHYLTPQMRDKNLFLNTSVAEDNDGRFLRIQQRLEGATSKLDAEEAISILRDQVDPYTNEVRGLGSTIGVHTTMSSLVLDAARNRMWIAAGRAPVSHSQYVEFPLVGHFQAEDFAQRPQRVSPGSEFPEHHPEKFAALQLFIAAKAAYEYKNDCRRARQLLEEAASTDSSNPAYSFQLAIFDLKCQDHSGALQALERTLTHRGLTSQLRRLAHYYRGRVLAHAGQATTALRDLAVVVEDPTTDEKLRSAASAAARTTRLFGRCRLRRRSLLIMMQQSDMLHY